LKIYSYLEYHPFSGEVVNETLVLFIDYGNFLVLSIEINTTNGVRQLEDVDLKHAVKKYTLDLTALQADQEAFVSRNTANGLDVSDGRLKEPFLLECSRKGQRLKSLLLAKNQIGRAQDQKRTIDLDGNLLLYFIVHVIGARIVAQFVENNPLRKLNLHGQKYRLLII